MARKAGWLRRDGPLGRHIERVSVPTLLLSGDHDGVVSPAAARAVARSRPDWTFHVFDDSGHIPQMEHPQAFLEVVGSWLAQVRSSAGDRAAARPGGGPAGSLGRGDGLAASGT